MCGILGFVANDGRPASRSRLLAANERMHARGPDGAGEFVEGDVALAMRRLAVIDVAGGNQPLFARDGEVVAFQNGEIYNHEALRRELEAKGFVFKTRSDTEVLAHGFVAWGMDGLLQRIDGMHAIALLDRTARTLWLARDRFGEKPLFVKRADGDGGRHDDPKIAFASSIKALGQLVGRTFEIDPIGLDAYLALHFVPGRRTIFRGVERVLPGERWKIELDSGRSSGAASASSAADTRPSSRRERRRPAPRSRRGRSRLVSDIMVGVFLSGGLDGSLVAALAAARHRLFSMGFAGDPDADETRFAELVARHVGSRHHAFRFDSTSFLPLFADVAAALDEPVGDPAQLPLLWLCREARQVATVVLSGEGADELFGGYDYYAPFAPAVGLRERWARWRSPGAGAVGAAARGRTSARSRRASRSCSRARRRALLDGALRDPDEWGANSRELGTARIRCSARARPTCSPGCPTTCWSSSTGWRWRSLSRGARPTSTRSSPSSRSRCRRPNGRPSRAARSRSRAPPLRCSRARSSNGRSTASCCR
jgi:asparagine synthase (glutamine-hydrolysing)